MLLLISLPRDRTSDLCLPTKVSDAMRKYFFLLHVRTILHRGIYACFILVELGCILHMKTCILRFELMILWCERMYDLGSPPISDFLRILRSICVHKLLFHIEVQLSELVRFRSHYNALLRVKPVYNKLNVCPSCDTLQWKRVFNFAT